MKNLIRIFPVILFFLASINNSFAQLITGKPPTITITDINGMPATFPYATLNSELNTELSNAWDQLIVNATPEVEKYSNQEKLAKGFANANLYSSRPATLQGYQDYSLFAFASGIMIGVQSPAFQIDEKRIKNIRDDIFRDGDAYLGMNACVAIANLGINAGFIYPGLYFNFIWGHTFFNGKNYNTNLEGFTHETTLYGLGINYNIVWSATIVPGLLRWRGISIGTGFSYSAAKTTIELDYIEPVQAPFSVTESGYTVDGTLNVAPIIGLEVKTKNITIPLDLSTSVKLFSFLNFNFGIGVDFNYGYGNVALNAKSDVQMTLNNSSDIQYTTETGDVLVNAKTKNVKASVVNPRITSGIGFNFSVIKIDIPVAVYLDRGFAAGLSMGIVW